MGIFFKAKNEQRSFDIGEPQKAEIGKNRHELYGNADMEDRRENDISLEVKTLFLGDGSAGKRECGILERVYDKTNGILFGYAMSILKDQGLAEDAVQESFLRLSKNLDKIDSPESKRTLNYMITIVKNLCYTIYNKRAKGPNIRLEENDTDTETDTDSVEDIVIHKEDYI